VSTPAAPTAADHDEVADLVTRTLQAVADATPVAARPPRDLPGLVIPLGTRSPSPAVARRSRWVVAAGAVAAALVAGGLVPLRSWLDGDPGQRPAVRIDDPATGGTMPAGRLVPTWLPAGLPRAGRPLAARGTAGTRVQASLWTRDNDDAALVTAVIDGPAGTAVSADTVDQTAVGITGLFGQGPGDSVVTGRSGGRGFVAVRRGGATLSQARTAVDRLAAGQQLDKASPGGDWDWHGFDLGWVEGAAVTTGTLHAAGGRSVEISTVTGEFPGADVLVPLVGARPLAGAPSAWAWRPGDRTEVLWPVAAGVTGRVVAHGLSPAELARVITGLRPVGLPPSAPNVRATYLSTPGAAVPFAVQWEGRSPLAALDAPSGGREGPCTTLWVAGRIIGPACGAGPEDMGPSVVARTDTVDVIFDVVGAQVSRVTTGNPRVPGGATHPLVPTDPTGGDRWVVLTVPRGPTSLHLDYRAADGRVVSSTDVELEGALGG